MDPNISKVISPKLFAIYAPHGHRKIEVETPFSRIVLDLTNASIAFITKPFALENCLKCFNKMVINQNAGTLVTIKPGQISKSP